MTTTHVSRPAGLSPEEIEGLVYGRYDDLVRSYVRTGGESSGH
jgi:hypothetical protein